ncbi:MAG: hypothetical protein ACRC7N_12830 [Clostridium sp.]
MNLVNPYIYEGIWVKGNLHTHTENSKCGHYKLEDILKMYTSYRMEYDYLAITDHCQITDLDGNEDREDILLFNGVEFKASAFQTLGIGVRNYSDDNEESKTHQEIFDDVIEQGGINIICHPHIYNDDYWPYNKLMELNGYTGIEIFNNNVKMDNSGHSIATDIWDKLLSSGKKVWGFANDDMHVFSRVGGGYNITLVDSKSKEDILNALRRGSFYATSGLILDNIKIDNNIISLEIKDKRVPYVTFRYIGKNGVILKEEKSQNSSYEIQGNEGYVRVEVERNDGVRAWLQPIFID